MGRTTFILFEVVVGFCWGLYSSGSGYHMWWHIYTYLIVNVDHIVRHTIGKVWRQPHRFAEVTLFAYALRLTFVAFRTLGQYRRSRRTRWPINAKRTIVRTQFDGLTINDIHVHTFRHLTNTIRWDACIVCWLLLSVPVRVRRHGIGIGKKQREKLLNWNHVLLLLEWVLPDSNHT